MKSPDSPDDKFQTAFIDGFSADVQISAIEGLGKVPQGESKLAQATGIYLDLVLPDESPQAADFRHTWNR